MKEEVLSQLAQARVEIKEFSYRGKDIDDILIDVMIKTENHLIHLDGIQEKKR